MHFLKSIVAGITVMLVCTGMVLAQQQQPQQPQQQMPDVPAPEDIDDDELETFVEASDAIQPIQEKAQGDMQTVIEDEGMDIERFQQIMMAMQNPQMSDQVDISSEEEQAIELMQPKLRDIEVGASDEIRNEIADKGLEVERYQAIFMSLQQHPELMERLEELMDE
ncbi:MAG: DUF4168 domain-containing protein [Balneolaceae bacterium]